MEKKLFIFDLDGTLMDAYQIIWKSLTHTFSMLGYPPVDFETAKRSVGMGDTQFMIRFFRPEDVERARAIYRSYHLSNLQGNVSLMPGAIQLLEYLKDRGRFMAVASNRPRATGEALLKTLDIQHYFQKVLFADMISRPKPEPEIIETLAQFFHVEKNEILFVGDMDIDVNTGKNAGVATAVVPTGSSTRQELMAAKPEFFCESLMQLLELLKNGKLS